MENKGNGNQSNRVSIIETVQTPLGFFTLTVLVVEVILGSRERTRTLTSVQG